MLPLFLGSFLQFDSQIYSDYLGKLLRKQKHVFCIARIKTPHLDCHCIYFGSVQGPKTRFGSKRINQVEDGRDVVP